MPLEQAFIDDCPYGGDGLVIDDVVSIDSESGEVVVSVPVHAELPITRHQKVHPIRHPRHLSGGLMIHITGMVGFVHAYYVLGLRHAQGWIGYGASIHHARFSELVEPGQDLIVRCKPLRQRKGDKKIFVRYGFEATQGEKHFYKSEQSAIWMKIETPDG